ncbi:MAG: YbaB/EbfC family nucleoid-associated protein [Mycoplasmatota bacterium]|nr:YbaB/EbfC family nucleoid-associated protein [Mycoplasmatota bacterium]
MNMQKLMMEAQKMQAQLQKDQKELENTIYDGSSSLVSVKMNGKYELVDVKINLDDDFSADDKEMLEDMLMVAVNEASKKVLTDKEKKMGKYGQGLAGLM